MPKIEKIKIWIFIIFRTILIGTGITAILTQNYVNFFLTTLTLFLTFLPTIAKKKFMIESPSLFEIIILFLICGSIYLGEIQSFYEKFWWWDLFLHTLSGIIMGAIGFSLVYILNKSKHLKLSPIFVVMFAFTFAVSINVFWEIFEYIVDMSFGSNMLKSGMSDTMSDLIVDIFSALFISVLGFLSLKKKSKIFDEMKIKIIHKKN